MDAFRDVLLVEDNPEDAELTLLALRKYIHSSQVSRAEDGLQALDFLYQPGHSTHWESSQVPRLILLDLRLPRFDGFQVLKAIREHCQTVKVPVVIVTASNNPVDVRRSYELGANSYIVKSVNFDQFRQDMSIVGKYWLQINQTAQ
jgi:two-component system response regulator